MKQNKQANEKNKLLSNYLKSHTFWSISQTFNSLKVSCAELIFLSYC